MTNSTTTRPQREKLARPSRKWKNWWKTDVDGVLPWGQVVKAGDSYPDSPTYPSKEIAEQKAQEWIAKFVRVRGRIGGEYLGAHQVDE